MKETRRFYIKNKIFTKENIRDIGKLFDNEYNSSKKAGNHSSVKYKVDCVDGTTYEKESLDLFDNGGILDLKKVISIEISYYDYKLERDMTISMVHGGGYRDHLLVSGDDSTWVNGIFSSLCEKVNLSANQDNWALRHKVLVFNLFSLGFGALVYLVIWLVLFRHIEPISNPTGIIKTMRTFFHSRAYILHSLDWVSYWGMGLMISPSVYFWFYKLWPTIEFNFGPEHLKFEQKRRQQVIFVVVVVVIPILLSALYDAIKLFIKI